jgi:HPt (histidine-containing phosphotransfer) domain-containing protein
MMAAIRDALDRRQPERLEQAAQALKGAVSILGARGAQQASLRLESIGRSRDLASVDEAWKDLEDAIEELKPALSPVIGTGDAAVS